MMCVTARCVACSGEMRVVWHLQLIYITGDFSIWDHHMLTSIAFVPRPSTRQKVFSSFEMMPASSDFASQNVIKSVLPDKYHTSL